MSNDIIEKYLIYNNKTYSIEHIDKLDTKNSLSIYEVIRVINGIPLFLEKHLERMQASARLLGRSIDAISGALEGNIHKLIQINGSPNKNIRVVAYNLDKAEPDVVMYYIHSSYPTVGEYLNGVPATLYHAERKNPNAKVVNQSFKDSVAKAMADTNTYEALLVNENGLLTEGSRSNLFFIRGRKVYTAPGSMVLVGITRVCVFEACRRSGFEVIEEAVPSSALPECEAVFISGTSPKVLPINSIDGKSYHSAANPIVMKITKAYDQILQEYIASKK